MSDKGPRHYTELSKTSADLYPGLNEELGGGFEYKRNGFISLVHHRSGLGSPGEYHPRANQIPAWGSNCFRLKSCRDSNPLFLPKFLAVPIAHRWSLNPLKFAAKLVQQLRARQVKIIRGQEARTIEVAGRRITAVITDSLRVTTNTVINAAGIDVPKTVPPAKRILARAC